MFLPCLGDKKLIESVRGLYMKGSAQGRRRSGDKYLLPLLTKFLVFDGW